MNPYDEPTSRRARSPQPNWDDEYPGARDYAEADRSAAGRAVVGRAPVRPISPTAPPDLDRPGAWGPGDRGPRGPYDDDVNGGDPRRRPRARETDPKAAQKARRRNLLIAGFAVFIMLTGLGVVGATYYVDSVPTPGQLNLPESTR